MIGMALFAVFSGVLCASATAVVRTKNLVHSVFWLAATLIMTAGLFLLLDAAFLAGIQLILYTGGVITLMLFGVMLTQRDGGTDIPNPISTDVPAAWTASLLFGLLMTGIWFDTGLGRMIPDEQLGADAIGRLFLTDHLIAFELLSILLLAAMIGAIVLARRTDP
jgi:NADH:ubiquinone oxidoreductase subunit 6 (subunit J)